MLYKSTRGGAESVSFQEVLFFGLAPDGGLYIPEILPKYDTSFLSSMVEMSYEEVAFAILKPFVGSLFSDQELNVIISKAYSEFRKSDKFFSNS